MRKLKRKGKTPRHELDYIRDINPNNGNGYILIRSGFMDDGGPAVWSVMVEDRGTLEIVGMEQGDWKAFVEIPDFFDFLAEKIMVFRRFNDELHTLDSIEEWLIQHNYKVSK